MYSSCLYCGATLDKNDMIECLPVGRRLAYHSATERVWVVCRRCSRWSLAPLATAGEAIDVCERLFRNGRPRRSTGNVSLARVGDRLELVRIGDAQRREVAAWRYGEEFRRRRRNSIVSAAVGTAVIGALKYLLPALNPALYGSIPILAYAPELHRSWRAHRMAWRPVARLHSADGQGILIRGQHVGGAQLVAGDDGRSWRLRVEHPGGTALLDGATAFRILGRLLVHVNATGGGAKTVEEAVDRLTSAPSPQAFILQQVKRARTESRLFGRRGGATDADTIDGLTPTTRLALEMAIHEESEGAAIDGERDAIDDAWREAEELAAIARDRR